MDSTFIDSKGQVEFQSVCSFFMSTFTAITDAELCQPKAGPRDFSGRQIRYGIREFEMIAIVSGLNAYQNGMIIPSAIGFKVCLLVYRTYIFILFQPT